MMKVCYVIGTLEVGGAEKQLYLLLKNLDREKFIPLVVALRGGRMKEEFEGIVRVLVLGKKWKIDPSFIVRLIRVLRRERPDILHTFMFTSNTWGRIAGIIARVPVIIASERCVDVWKKWHHRMVDRILMFSTFRIVGNSEAVKLFYQRTEKIPEGKMAVVYNGVDLNGFANIGETPALKKEIGVEWAGFIIGAGGRFTEQKGLINLLKAAPAVLKAYPDSCFVLVGDGPLRRAFEEFVEKSGLSGNVIFTGYRKDIIRIFSLCDVIVVPSLFEGMPNIVLEAMALKKPIVGTEIPEIEELVTDGKNGLLVPAKDARALAEKIIFLLAHPELRKSMGEKGYGFVRERFSVRKMVRGYEELYEIASSEKGDRYLRSQSPGGANFF